MISINSSVAGHLSSILLSSLVRFFPSPLRRRLITVDLKSSGRISRQLLRLHKDPFSANTFKLKSSSHFLCEWQECRWQKRTRRYLQVTRRDSQITRLFFLIPSTPLLLLLTSARIVIFQQPPLESRFQGLLHSVSQSACPGLFALHPVTTPPFDEKLIRDEKLFRTRGSWHCCKVKVFITQFRESWRQQLSSRRWWWQYSVAPSTSDSNHNHHHYRQPPTHSHTPSFTHR